MPHIHAFVSTKADTIKNTQLREMASQDGACTCWVANVHDCGEPIGDMEAVAIIQPGTTLLNIWVGWEGGDGEEYAEEFSLMRAIRDLARESVQTIVDEI